MDIKTINGDVNIEDEKVTPEAQATEYFKEYTKYTYKDEMIVIYEEFLEIRLSTKTSPVIIFLHVARLRKRNLL